MVSKVILVGIGGSVGSILRFLTSYYVNRSYTQSFPLATFTVNILGCLLIGILIGLSGKFLSEEMKLLFITGFCGSYTTFSTFSAENLHLFQSGQYFTLILYILLSIIVGFLAVLIGYTATNWFLAN